MSALVAAAADTQADLAGWYQRSLRPRLQLAVSRGEADPRQAEELERLLGQLLHAQPPLTHRKEIAK